MKPKNFFFFVYFQKYKIQIDFLNHQIHSDITEKSQIDHEYKELKIEFKA
jgi:hypothetical protein